MATPRADSYSVESGVAVYAGRFSLPAWRRGLTALAWYELGENVVTDVDPANDPAINPNYPAAAPWVPLGNQLYQMCEEWSGGSWDETNQRFWIFGGGHDGYQGNEGYAIDLSLDSPIWERRGYPTGSIQKPGAVRTRNGSSWGSDGRPLAIHTYGLLTVLPNGRIFTCKGGAAYDSGHGGPSAYEFDPISNDYDMTRLYTATDYAYYGLTGSCTYDPSRNKVYETSGPYVIAYDIAAQTAGIVYGALYGPEFGLSSTLIRIPEHDILVNFGGVSSSVGTGNSTCIIDPASITSTPVPITSAADQLWSLYGVAYDTLRKRVLGWPGGASVETLTPPPTNPKAGTWVYSSLTTSTTHATPTARNSHGTYGRFFYNAKLDCAVAFNRTSEKLFVLPLS